MSLDPNTPNLARMYDYMLGGKDNLPVDRVAVDQLAQHIPAATPLARANRAFLQRAVRHLAAAGVRQFLDLGSGLPTQGNVHEVVRDVAPGAKVVYVDHDPVVAAHAATLLQGEERVRFVRADLLCPAELLAAPEVSDFLDLAEPVGVSLVSILHFVPDAGDPAAMVAILRDAVAPGSHLALTHAVSTLGRGDTKPSAREAAKGAGEASAEEGTEGEEEGAKTVYRGSSAGGATGRSLAEIRGFFGDFELVEPGLVQAADWRPDGSAGHVTLPGYLLAGVAKKTLL
ncbi:SAM-dependent methyltransferase [Nonomuraea sp. K274]|uniref:SAM-dependent methyltransferase n=1 Tax=Nonomuraea cypriaca TaxID=1187855 RepID=A0A931A3Q2_9ACTN|nr:SAM-dependent methyltransferase [Nonomuraea cypriaca]MBF8185696.1 SAM-dependent methyltransferase [Nonomuraea cypriaca]